MKKALVVLMAGVLGLSLVGCGADEGAEEVAEEVVEEVVEEASEAIADVVEEIEEELDTESVSEALEEVEEMETEIAEMEEETEEGAEGDAEALMVEEMSEVVDELDTEYSEEEEDIEEISEMGEEAEEELETDTEPAFMTEDMSELVEEIESEMEEEENIEELSEMGEEAEEELETDTEPAFMTEDMSELVEEIESEMEEETEEESEEDEDADAESVSGDIAAPAEDYSVDLNYDADPDDFVGEWNLVAAYTADDGVIGVVEDAISLEIELSIDTNKLVDEAAYIHADATNLTGTMTFNDADIDDDEYSISSNWEDWTNVDVIGEGNAEFSGANKLKIRDDDDGIYFDVVTGLDDYDDEIDLMNVIGLNEDGQLIIGYSEDHIESDDSAEWEYAYIFEKA